MPPNVIERSASYTHHAAATPCVLLAAKSTVPLKVTSVATHGRGEKAFNVKFTLPFGVIVSWLEISTWLLYPPNLVEEGALQGYKLSRPHDLQLHIILKCYLCITV